MASAVAVPSTTPSPRRLGSCTCPLPSDTIRLGNQIVGLLPEEIVIAVRRIAANLVFQDREEMLDPSGRLPLLRRVLRDPEDWAELDMVAAIQFHPAEGHDDG